MTRLRQVVSLLVSGRLRYGLAPSWSQDENGLAYHPTGTWIGPWCLIRIRKMHRCASCRRALQSGVFAWFRDDPPQWTGLCCNSVIDPDGGR